MEIRQQPHKWSLHGTTNWDSHTREARLQRPGLGPHRRRGSAKHALLLTIDSFQCCVNPHNTRRTPYNIQRHHIRIFWPCFKAVVLSSTRLACAVTFRDANVAGPRMTPEAAPGRLDYPRTHKKCLPPRRARALSAHIGVFVVLYACGLCYVRVRCRRGTQLLGTASFSAFFVYRLGSESMRGEENVEIGQPGNKSRFRDREKKEELPLSADMS